MKLVFPGGEHPQVLLGPGVNRIGSDPGANIVLDRPGVRPSHCELHVTAGGVMLQVPEGTNVTVNGRGVDGLIALRPGDDVMFDGVRARLASMEATAPREHQAPAATRGSANDDPGATAVHPVVPRYVLRGVADRAFGRTWPLVGPVVLGRGDECSLCLDLPGLSRRHARLTPNEQGVLVEDLGSTNGSFINGARVQRGQARPGDELAFDRVRFQLVAPGQPVQARPEATPVAFEGPSPWWWLVLALAALATLWILALF
jgi:pSer/pThr/pTyr-binding forkhead associated (FHA) protein